MRIAVGDVTRRAVQIGGIAPHVIIWRCGIQHEYCHPPLSVQQRRFESFHHPRLVRRANAHSILHDVQHDRTLAFLLRVHTRVALGRQKLFDLRFLEILRHRHRKRDRDTRILGLSGAQFQINVNRIRCIASHHRTAAFAMQLRESREHELKVIVHLGHRAHRRA